MIPPAPPAHDLATRPAGPADRESLATLVAACERTYLEWAPAGWTVPEMAPAWLRRVGDPEFWSLCALDAAGTVAGFACFGPARSSGTPAAFAAGGAHIAHVVALYVHPSHWRQSVATALLARAEEAMRTRGYGAARLWTPTGAPAERFYAARGWRPDGRSVWDGWLGLQLVGYAKRL